MYITVACASCHQAVNRHHSCTFIPPKGPPPPPPTPGLGAKRLNLHLAMQVFVASALLEWQHDNSNVKVPKNIWELGAKRFMAEPGFVLAYIDFQLGLGDTANCRATFERGLTVTPVPEAKPLWDQYLRFESQVCRQLFIIRQSFVCLSTPTSHAWHQPLMVQQSAMCLVIASCMV